VEWQDPVRALGSPICNRFGKKGGEPALRSERKERKVTGLAEMALILRNQSSTGKKRRGGGSKQHGPSPPNEVTAPVGKKRTWRTKKKGGEGKRGDSDCRAALLGQASKGKQYISSFPRTKFETVSRSEEGRKRG